MSILCYAHKIDITKIVNTVLPKAKTALQASLTVIVWINSYPELTLISRFIELPSLFDLHADFAIRICYTGSYSPGLLLDEERI
jgi:hypothetical protein